MTGQPIWPFEERAVPKGDVPGEWYSATQPFPTKPAAYDRQGASVNDLIDFTPELREQALKVVSQYEIGPMFTPPVVSKVGGPLGTLAMATAGGGTNWPGGSYDPETHILYVFSQTVMSSLGLVPGDANISSDFAYVQGIATSGIRTSGGAGADASADRAPAGGGCPSPKTRRVVSAKCLTLHPDRFSCSFNSQGDRGLRFDCRHHLCHVLIFKGTSASLDVLRVFAFPVQAARRS